MGFTRAGSSPARSGDFLHFLQVPYALLIVFTVYSHVLGVTKLNVNTSNFEVVNV